MEHIAVIPNTLGHYIIDSNGAVFSRKVREYKKGTMGVRYRMDENRRIRLKYFLDVSGYRRACISYPIEKRKNKKVPIHTLMLLSFIGPRPIGKECAHIDGNKLNNKLENLKWASKSENNSMKLMHGTDMRGEKHPSCKFSNDEMRLIRSIYLKGGASIRGLARKFKTNHMSIRRILKRDWL